MPRSSPFWQHSVVFLLTLAVGLEQGLPFPETPSSEDGTSNGPQSLWRGLVENVLRKQKALCPPPVPLAPHFLFTGLPTQTPLLLSMELLSTGPTWVPAQRLDLPSRWGELRAAPCCYCTLVSVRSPQEGRHVKVKGWLGFRRALSPSWAWPQNNRKRFEQWPVVSLR